MTDNKYIFTDLKKYTVTHKTFGNGTVIELADSYITMQFADKTRKFVFPDAFMTFLKCENISLQKELESAYLQK